MSPNEFSYGDSETGLARLDDDFADQMPRVADAHRIGAQAVPHYISLIPSAASVITMPPTQSGLGMNGRMSILRIRAPSR